MKKLMIFTMIFMASICFASTWEEEANKIGFRYAIQCAEEYQINVGEGVSMEIFNRIQIEMVDAMYAKVFLDSHEEYWTRVSKLYIVCPRTAANFEEDVYAAKEAQAMAQAEAGNKK